MAAVLLAVGVEIIVKGQTGQDSAILGAALLFVVSGVVQWRWGVL